MLLRITSDLHTEFWPEDQATKIKILDTEVLPPMENDAKTWLVLAGDFFLARDALDYYSKKGMVEHLCKRFKKVIYVTGNHEFYQFDYYHLEGFLKGLGEVTLSNKGKNKFTYLENEFLTVDAKRTFYGAAFWTDYDNDHPAVHLLATDKMNDSKAIKNLSTQLLWANNHVCRRMLELSVQDSPEKDFFVVTHHAPSFLSIPEEFKVDPLNGAYANTRLEDFLMDNPNVKLWVHGHIHKNSDYMIGNCRVLANPYGYRGKGLNKDYNPTLTVEI